MSATASPGTRVVAGELHRVQRGRGKRFSAHPTPEPSRRPARVAVMLALAHKILQAIEQGELRDQAEAARKLGLTRARLTQLLGLTFLAPGLQEQVLFLVAIDGAEPLTERCLRAATQARSWAEQKNLAAHLS